MWKTKTPPKKKRGRYNVSDKKDRTKDGVVYDSKHEMLYSKHLDLLIKAKEIISYERQIKYPLHVGGDLICHYILDFKVVYSDGSIQYIDCKASKRMTEPVYKLKKKLMKAIHGIDIKEIYQK